MPGSGLEAELILFYNYLLVFCSSFLPSICIHELLTIIMSNINFYCRNHMLQWFQNKITPESFYINTAFRAEFMGMWPVKMQEHKAMHWEGSQAWLRLCHCLNILNNVLYLRTAVLQVNLMGQWSRCEQRRYIQYVCQAFPVIWLAYVFRRPHEHGIPMDPWFIGKEFSKIQSKSKVSVREF